MDQSTHEKPVRRRFAVPISWKLLGATAIVGTVAAVIAIIGLKRIQTLNQSLTETVDFLATKVKLASLLKQDLVTVTRAERSMMLAQSDDGTNQFAVVVDEVVDTMGGRLKELRALVGEKDQRQLDLFSTKWAEWRKNHEDVRRFTGMNSNDEARKISVGEARQASEEMEAALETMALKYRQRLDAAKQDDQHLQVAQAAEMLALLASVSQASLEMQRTEKNLILAESEDELRRYDEESESLKKDLQDQMLRLQENAGKTETSEMATAQRALAEYIDANTRIRSTAGERSNFLAYHFVYEVGAPIAAECEALLDGLVKSNEQEMQQHERASRVLYAEARNTLLGISICGIFISVAISFYTGHRVASRLGILSRYAQTIQSTGDLSKPTPNLGNDEVGLLAQSFDQMRQSLYEHALSLSRQAERLSELTQTLETKNREMEQFVYTVSHDLKSPLVSCKGLLGLLKEDVAECDYGAILESIGRLDQATDQLNQIIEDLLMLSRIGRKSLDLTQVDVGAMVDELIHELDDRIASANAQVEVDSQLPSVTADKSDVRRIFENLLTNALKYGGNTSRLEIQVGGHSERREVKFFVRDNGPGIAPNYHKKIFELFQRLDTDQPGTGLGLASVAKVMDMHGGRAWVESEQGQGATFWVAFPHPPNKVRI